MAYSPDEHREYLRAWRARNPDYYREYMRKRREKKRQPKSCEFTHCWGCIARSVCPFPAECPSWEALPADIYPLPSNPSPGYEED